MSLLRSGGACCAAAIVLSSFPGAAALAQEAVADPQADVQACIASNAERVEQAFASLPEAVSFLTYSICAEPVAAAARALADADKAARKARADAFCAGLPAPGPEAVYDPRVETCRSQEINEIFATYGAEPSAASYIQPDPRATSLASSLLLDARPKRATQEH